jgi:hypothetical protein
MFTLVYIGKATLEGWLRGNQVYYPKEKGGHCPLKAKQEAEARRARTSGKITGMPEKRKSGSISQIAWY